MSKDASDAINSQFSINAIDVTPASARDFTQIMYVPVSAHPAFTTLCSSVLSDAELKRADRFASNDAKILFIQRRAFRRWCGASAIRQSRSLSQIDFRQTESGRPYLFDSSDISFGFSSCRFGFVGAWSSTHDVGVDVEDQAADVQTDAIADLFFSKAEVAAIGRLSGQESRHLFFRFWSLKEAALKCIGEGIPFGLDKFEFELGTDLRVVRSPSGHGSPACFAAHMIDGTSGCAALVTRNSI